MQVPPAALDLRAESDAWAGQGLMTTAAADREVDVFGRGDLKRHVAAHEFEAVVGADAPSLQVGTEAGAAGRAHRRWVLDVRAHYDRLAAPMPFRAGLFACGPAGLHLVQFASALGRGGGSLGVVSAVRATGRRLASLATPIGVVTRRRPRTGRRVLARAVGQRTRQLVQPPRQLLELLARHRREVCPLHIVQVGVESVRHARRRILFASIRKPAARLSDDDRIRLIAPVRTRGGVNGYSESRLYFATSPLCPALDTQMRRSAGGKGNFPPRKPLIIRETRKESRSAVWFRERARNPEADLRRSAAHAFPPARDPGREILPPLR